MDTWVNGAYGSEVKRVIDNNFDILDKRTEKMNERMTEIDDYMSNISTLHRNFVASNWSFNESLKAYIISIPYADYKKTNPFVEVYIKDDDGYSIVYGGCKIVENGVDLCSDIPYEGRVVIR